MIVKPPHVRHRPADENHPTVFLGGSIEMGTAAPWQQVAERELEGCCSIIYNPRRDDWDASWEQSVDNPNFTAQVNWELEFIERADLVLFHFDENTKSPITLMELGLTAFLKPQSVVVSCPKEFWRRGNVEIVCERYGIHIEERLPLALGILQIKARQHSGVL